MPAWMLWLSPVVLAPLIAVVVIAWYARPRKPVAAIETVEEYDRFRAAMTTPLPHPRRKPQSRSQARPKAPVR